MVYSPQAGALDVLRIIQSNFACAADGPPLGQTQN